MSCDAIQCWKKAKHAPCGEPSHTLGRLGCYSKTLWVVLTLEQGEATSITRKYSHILF